MRYFLQVADVFLQAIMRRCLKGLQRLNTLPDETIVCPAHEYTLGNLAFAETVLVEKVR